MTENGRTSAAARLIGIVLFAGVPAVLVTQTVLSLVDITVARTSAANQETLLARFESRFGVRPPEKAGLDTTRLYLSGTSRSVASANLRERIVAAVTAAGGVLIETRNVEQPGSAETLGQNEIRVSAVFDTNNARLAAILYDLEAGLPLIGIESLSVRPSGREGENENPMLRIELLARAAMQGATP